MKMHAYDIFFEEVEPALDVKIDEFRFLGYEHVTRAQLWEYLKKKKWKTPKSTIRLFEIVEDVLGIKVGEFINYTTVEAYMDTEFSLENAEEMKQLLK